MIDVERVGSNDPDVAIFNKGGRESRIERLSRGEETPREFFYGYFDLEQAGISAVMMSSSGSAPGIAGAAASFLERAAARLTRLGVRPLSARMTASWLNRARVAISFTDGFSLSLGLGLPRRNRRTILIGGFQGLSDIEERAPKAMRGTVRRLIRRSISGLDHVFFLGPADRRRAIERYGVSADRSSHFTFGVDTDFWRPVPAEKREDFVLAVGQDLNRDFDLLAAAPGSNPILIITRNPVAVPPGAGHVKIMKGGLFQSDAISDVELRGLYNAAVAVVVPVKDVYQPSGQSVTLQAMSCGRPVILTRTRGLWAPDVLHDGENCLLVPCGDAAALGSAIQRLRNDSALAERLGSAARQSVLAHFGLDKMGADTVALARLGLSLADQRSNC